MEKRTAGAEEAAEKVLIAAFLINEAWQGLKPAPLFASICGPAEAVPLLQNKGKTRKKEFFRSL